MAAAVVWSLPMLAAGLVALLRYGFGSLFVVGESVASALLRSTGADIAGTLAHLHADPVRGAMEAAAGLLLAAGAGALALSRPVVAAGLAALSAAEGWWYGIPLVSALLVFAVLSAALGAILARRG